MQPTFFKGIVLGAVTSMLMLGASVAVAASGGNFILGVPNTATSATELNNTDTTAADSGLEVRAASASAPAIRGRHTNSTGTGPALVGESSSTSPGAIGLLGLILPSSPGTNSAGVLGRNNGTGSAGFGVFGSHLGSGAGVMGQSVGGPAVIALSQTGNGVLGRHTAATGVAAGVQGETSSTDPNATAILGKNLGGGPGLSLTVAAGAAPMKVNSTAKVVNLNADQLDGNDAGHFATQAGLAALQARVAALEAKLAAVSYDDTAKLLTVTGANVEIVDGSGDTVGTPNGLGNLIVGYNADEDAVATRTGSHNLVVGDEHSYTRFGGLVAGFRNRVTADWASVSGGTDNTASGAYASVSGGLISAATGPYASVSGGLGSAATGPYASVSGGLNNRANGQYASVSGGASNQANADSVSVSGGLANVGSWEGASVSGGTHNTASSYGASVSGGYNNIASGERSSVSGGLSNTAAGRFQWLGGTLVARSTSTPVAGGAEGNGDYASKSLEIACNAGEQLVSGGASWDPVVDVNDDLKELPILVTRPTAALTGWTVRGGNDTNISRQLRVHTVCLGP